MSFKEWKVAREPRLNRRVAILAYKECMDRGYFRDAADIAVQGELGEVLLQAAALADASRTLQTMKQLDFAWKTDIISYHQYRVLLAHNQGSLDATVKEYHLDARVLRMYGSGDIGTDTEVNFRDALLNATPETMEPN